jgi:hypothetical protein
MPTARELDAQEEPFMRHVIWRFMADLSRAANRASGGASGKTLCNRAARAWGYDCWFCAAIGCLLNDRDHCLLELDAQEIVDLAKRRK